MIATTRTLTLSTLFAMLLGLMLVHPAGAVVGTSRQSAEQLADDAFQRCQDYGGTPSIHFDLDSDGSIVSISVSCKGGIGPFSCSYFQHEGYTMVVCALMPGQQSNRPNAPVGGGVLEDVDVTSSPTNGFPTGGVLTTPETGSSRSRVIVGAFQPTNLAEDDE